MHAMRLLFCLFVLGMATVARAEDALPVEQIDARLRHAYALAKETNNRLLVEEMLTGRDTVTRAIGRQDGALVERLLRDMEKQVGLDPGGKTMAGLPVAVLTYAEQKQLAEIGKKLTAAMKAGKTEDVQAGVAEMKKLLGDRAGVPDSRRKGESPAVIPVKPAELADLFVRILDAEQAKLKSFAVGKPLPAALPRDYANIAEGCVAFRPLVEKYQPKKLDVVDQLIAGCCESMVALQTEAGFFKFPDLRGKHIRFGEMIEQLVEQSAGNVEDGFLIVPAPDGGSQFDAGECGVALLRAGAALKKPDWTKAGLKAAAWAKACPPVATFNYNAFSVHLLCEAYRHTHEDAYRVAALATWNVGVAPGQTPNGRWIDPHNARTVYHFIMLRAANDLLELDPPVKNRDGIAESVQLAVKAALDEADKLGAPVTSYTVAELSRAGALAGITDPRLKTRLEQAATAAHLRCVKGGVKAATPFPELAAVAGVWK